ncbi:hypothetical protein L3X38_037085 [Prunus dulcis]|uniref:Integrase catalytic domain-containing protein n=1 Tax=Prunus dulcis TaxID=3755 RepID=A0AAD4YQY5_PRUDU|nr:hypothetical protein L3X38_037085 [Prunus dulcis]
MKCTKCGLDNHTIKGCYEIIGYPEGWVHKGRKKDSTRASFASAQSSEETASEPPSGTSGSKALATSGTSCTSSLTCNRSWIIDTGATDHMTSSFTGLHSTKPSSQTHITSANGTTSQVMGEGSLSLTSSLSLDHVLVVPSLDYDLLSVPQIIDYLNCTLCFWPLYCLFQDLLTRTVIGCGTRRGKLYYLDLTEDSSTRLSQTHHVKGDESIRMKKIWLWHRRLGHASFGYLKLLFPDLFSQFAESDFHCETCILAKSHRISYPLRLNKSSLPFMIVHSDVWGPSRVPTISDFKWFMTFIDDCTRMTWVFPLKQKSEVTAKFKLFYQYVATQFDKKITTLRSDNGGEYVNHDLHTFLSQHGIVHQTTCAYTPQQNGVAEHKNRHLLEVVRASLFEARMPHHFWGEALCSAAYLINRTPSSTLQYQTPFQTLTTLLPMPSTPNLEPRLFGCVAYVQVYPHQRGKLDPCALRCVFVGYAATQKGYKCFHPPTQTMHVTADVTFHESEFYYSGGVSEHPLQGESSIFAEDTQSIQIQQTVLEQSVSEQPATVVQQDQELLETPDDGSYNFPPTTVPSPIIQSGPEDSPQVTEHLNSNLSILHESSHTGNTGYQLPIHTTRGIPRQQYDPDPKTKVKYPIANHVSLHSLSLSCASFVCQLSTVSIPSNVQEALKDPKWTQAMNDEMEALQKNSTWNMTILPKGKRTVGCRWIYTVKFKADGTIERYKAKLVAKGYTQTYGIDYGETFAPVAKINTIRILLSLAANLNWPLHQFDVKNAFLHGNLEEEVYMDSPPGCKMGPNTSNMVCKLRKSLYGLKQSPRAWFGKFSKSMKDFGYKQSNSDHTLFLKHKKGKVTALIVYVDDMVVTGNDPVEKAALQHHLANKYMRTLRAKSIIPNPISLLSNQLSTVIPYNTKDQKDFTSVVMRFRVVVE